jgi:hypothetical protein
MTINQTFDQVYCINLKRRTDRRAHAESEFKKHGIEVEWIEGIDSKELSLPATLISSDGTPVMPGDLGCTASHSKVCKLAKERGFKNYLVIEDDAIFCKNFIELFPLYIVQVPNDYDFLYIGGSINGEQYAISENVVKSTNVYTTHAMAVKETVYDALIEVWEKQNEKVDLCVASLQSRFNTYAFRPFLIGQRPSYSDILEKDTDYEHLRVN